MDKVYRKSFGKALQVAHKLSGLNASQLSRVANVDRLTLRNIEAGIGNPKLSTLIDLSRALGISLADVFVEGERKIRDTEYDAESVSGRHVPDTTVQYFVTKL